MRRRQQPSPVGQNVDELAIVTVKAPVRAAFDGKCLVSKASDLVDAVGNPNGLVSVVRIGCGARSVITEARLGADFFELVLRLDTPVTGNGQDTLIAAAEEVKSLRHTLLDSLAAAAVWSERPDRPVEESIWRLVDATEALVASMHKDARVFVGDREVDLRCIRNPASLRALGGVQNIVGYVVGFEYISDIRTVHEMGADHPIGEARMVVDIAVGNGRQRQTELSVVVPNRSRDVVCSALRELSRIHAAVRLAEDVRKKSLARKGHIMEDAQFLRDLADAASQ